MDAWPDKTLMPLLMLIKGLKCHVHASPVSMLWRIFLQLVFSVSYPLALR